MPGEHDPSARIPFSLGELIAPGVLVGVLVGAIALLVHLVHPSSGTMFDEDNIGPTVVLGPVAIVALVVGIVIVRSSLRAVMLKGPCPACGTVAARGFESPVDDRSLPTQCGTCIAYLRANSKDEVLEEVDGPAHGLSVKFPYVLAADQYMPAVQHTNRKFFKFAMPKMCAACGDLNAHGKRPIKDGDHFGKDLGPWSQQYHVLPQVGSAHRSEPTEDDLDSKGLSNLRAPVCEKHTENADMFGDVIEYSSGKLEFSSYQYYKAFCELNNITRASVKRRRATLGS